METIEKLKKRLTKKLNEEYKEYISELEKLSVEEVIEKSYETTMKKQFLKLLGEEHSIERNEVKALLESDNTLDELYEQWDHDINNFDEVIEDNFICCFNEIVENYEEGMQFNIENDYDYELIQMIMDVLGDIDNYNYCDKFKKRYGISEIDTLIVDEILNDKHETEYLHDFLIDINNDEHIQHLCNIKLLSNQYYNNIHQKILPELREKYKEFDKNKSKKNKKKER